MSTSRSLAAYSWTGLYEERYLQFVLYVVCAGRTSQIRTFSRYCYDSDNLKGCLRRTEHFITFIISLHCIANIANIVSSLS